MPLTPPRILRYRTIITHATPTQREVTEELTLYNDSDKAVGEIILHGPRYRPGMNITDQDGCILGFFPNNVVRDLLKQSGDKDDAKLLQQIERHEKYIQWITLPKDRRIEPGNTRVIRISYTDATRPGRTLDSASKLLFNIPEFKVDKK